MRGVKIVFFFFVSKAYKNKLGEFKIRARCGSILIGGLLPAPPTVLLYPQKIPLYPYLSFARVDEIRWDAVNEIYCVTNLLHPQNFTLSIFLVFRCSPSQYFCSHSLLRGPLEFFLFAPFHKQENPFDEKSKIYWKRITESVSYTVKRIL